MPYLTRLCQALLLTAMVPAVALAGTNDTRPTPTTTTAVALHADKTTTTTTIKPLPTTITTRPTIDHGTPCATEIVKIIAQEWPTETAWAIQIAWRESNCQPDVVSGEHAMGLFQLLGHLEKIAASGGDWSNPIHNANAARLLYDECGRAPWTPPYGCDRP